MDADFREGKSRDEGQARQVGGQVYRLWKPGSPFFSGGGGGLPIGFERLKLAFGDVTPKDVQEVLPEVSFGLSSIDP